MDNEFNKIDKNAQKVWQLKGLITTIILLAINIAAVLYFKKSYWSLSIHILVAIYSIIISPSIKYKEWSYKITDHYVIFNEGIIFKSSSFIPIYRIQHIDISSGPLFRIYNLVEVTINTAGNTHTISGLHKVEAQKIVNNINSLILERISDENKK